MLSGSITALITPMLEDGSVDYTSLTKLIDWQIAQGSEGILIIGTTGESPTLTADEKAEIIELTVTHVNKRVPVIVGTGSNCTTSTIKNTQIAQGLGADIALLVTPYYNKPTQEGLYQHYASIAENCSIPQLLYNNPTRTMTDLLPETVARLQEFENIIGIKECVTDSTRLPALKRSCRDDFLFFTGIDEHAYEFIQQGGHGVISVTANIAPELLQAMCTALHNGDTAKANELHEQIIPLNHALGAETNPIPIKWAVAHLGKAAAGIRLPLTPLSKPAQGPLQTVINQLKLATPELSE